MNFWFMKICDWDMNILKKKTIPFFSAYHTPFYLYHVKCYTLPYIKYSRKYKIIFTFQFEILNC